MLEVVELKNTCPFQEAGTMTRNRKGQLRRQFRISDPGPRDKVPRSFRHRNCLQHLTHAARLLSPSSDQRLQPCLHHLAHAARLINLSSDWVLQL